MRILFLDIDTLRPDHLGCYGYGRNTSPNIDSLCKDGVRFDGYHCSDAPCLPSRAALTSGRFGIHSGAVGHGGTAADMRLDGPSRRFRSTMGFESLPSILKLNGYETASISTFAERHSAWWFYAGFKEMHNVGGRGDELAEAVSPIAIRWLGDHAKADNWFLHVNLWDPHTPYRTPDAFGNPFADAPGPEWITQEVFERHLEKVGPHSAHEINMYNSQTDPRFPRQPGELQSLADVKRMMDGYDCGIRYADEHVGRIIGALQEAGVYEETAIIVSSDHGENMGELGIYGEHGTADGITPRIPMIIKWPQGRRGAVDTGLHYNLDLAPTLTELLELERPKSWDGQSYAQALFRDVPGRDYLVLSQCAHVCQRSVRFEDWIYIRTYHDGYHMFPQEMLYNLNHDPHEQSDLAQERPDICERALGYYQRWHDEMMQSMHYDADPLWTVMREGGPFHARGALEKYCTQLEATGRTQAAQILRRRYAQEG